MRRPSVGSARLGMTLEPLSDADSECPRTRLVDVCLLIATIRCGTIKEQLLQRNEKRLRGGLVFEAHRCLYHSTLGSRVRQKKEEEQGMQLLRRRAQIGAICSFATHLLLRHFMPKHIHTYWVGRLAILARASPLHSTHPQTQAPKPQTHPPRVEG